jgi:hypothetical protein
MYVVTYYEQAAMFEDVVEKLSILCGDEDSSIIQQCCNRWW